MEELKEDTVYLVNTSSCALGVRGTLGDTQEESALMRFCCCRLTTLATVWRVDWWGVEETNCETLATVQ